MTEYCAGGELFSYVLDKMQLGDAEACQITKKLCETVKHMHNSAKICHRDLKPENVLFCEKRLGISGVRPTKNDSEIEIKVIDFGLSKILATTS